MPRGQSRWGAPLRAFQGGSSALNQHIGGQAKNFPLASPVLSAVGAIRGSMGQTTSNQGERYRVLCERKLAMT